MARRCCWRQNPTVVVHTGMRRLEAVAERLPLGGGGSTAELCPAAPPRVSYDHETTDRQELDGSADSCRRLATDMLIVALRTRR
jgi:hypothetical protein